MNNYFSNSKRTVWIISLLIALNLFTLSMLWLSNKGLHGRDQSKGPHDRGYKDKFMAEKLHLSEAQKEQFASFRKTHRELTKERFKKMRELRKERINILIQSQSDTLQLNKLAHQIGLQQTEIEILMSQHFLQLLSICDDGQKEKLGEVFYKIGERMGPRGK